MSRVPLSSVKDSLDRKNPIRPLACLLTSAKMCSVCTRMRKTAKRSVTGSANRFQAIARHTQAKTMAALVSNASAVPKRAGLGEKSW